ncbi:MAG: hypothetical protein M3404_00755 [Actinomycetota bacterium]|nr:hypothetical protein [Actinomycetota bacterium]
MVANVGKTLLQPVQGRVPVPGRLFGFGRRPSMKRPLHAGGGGGRQLSVIDQDVVVVDELKALIEVLRTRRGLPSANVELLTSKPLVSGRAPVLSYPSLPIYCGCRARADRGLG